MVKEIIQYEGESARVKLPNEKVDRSKVIVFWQKEVPVVDNPPPFDSSAEKRIRTGFTLNDGNWEAQYTVTGLSQEQIDKKAERDYLNGLNWEAYLQSALLSSYFSTIGVWAVEDSDFGRHIAQIFENLKLNIVTVRNEPILKIRMTELKAAIANPTLNLLSHAFTPEQVAAIESHLDLLNVNWNWDSF